MAGTAGDNAVITVGGVEVAKARDVTVTFNKVLADATTRAGAGWRGKCPTIKDISISGDQLWVATDTGLLAIESAWFNDTRVAFTLVDVSGGKGWSGNGYIGNLDKGEPLEGAQTLSFTLESDGVVTQTSTS